MTIPRFLTRWWRQLVAVLLVLAAVVGYGLTRGGGATGGAFSASPPATSLADPATPGGPTGPTGIPSPGGDAPTDPGPGTGGTTTSTITTTTTRGPTTQPPRSEHWAIRWILSLGPDGPTSPIFYIEPYLLLRDHKCDEALANIATNDYFDHHRSGPIYRGAATACLAAFHQQPQRWIEAIRHLAAAQSSSEDMNCPERATLAWLQQVVGLHERDPGRTFLAQEPQGFYTSIQQLVPDHGPKGTQVRVEGSNLDCTSGVEVSRQGSGSEPASFTRGPGGRSVTFTAPDGFGPGPSQVTLLNGAENYTIGTATFTYEAEGAGSSPGSSAGG